MFLTTAPVTTKHGTNDSSVKMSDFKQTNKKLGDFTLLDCDVFSCGSDPASEGHITAIKILDNGVANKCPE